MVLLFLSHKLSNAYKHLVSGCLAWRSSCSAARQPKTKTLRVKRSKSYIPFVQVFFAYPIENACDDAMRPEARRPNNWTMVSAILSSDSIGGLFATDRHSARTKTGSNNGIQSLSLECVGAMPG